MEKLAITLFNRKGGTGKTTIAAILAQLAVKDRKRVIVYDLDEQQNLTDTLNDVGVYDLRNRIKEGDENEDADIFIIDCPPALNRVTVEAIEFADIVLVPIRLDRYSLANLDVLYEEVERTGKARHQAAVIKNGFARTMITTEVNTIIQKRGFPVAGSIPQNQWLINNIATGAAWCANMPQEQQEPFIELYKRILRAFNRMLKNDIERMWK